MKISKETIAELLKKELSYDSIEVIREEIEKQYYLTEEKDIKDNLRKFGEALYFLQNNLNEDFNKIKEHYKKESNDLKRQSMLILNQIRELQEEDKKLKNRFRLVNNNIEELDLILELINK